MTIWSSIHTYTCKARTYTLHVYMYYFRLLSFIILCSFVVSHTVIYYHISSRTLVYHLMLSPLISYYHLDHGRSWKSSQVTLTNNSRVSLYTQVVHKHPNVVQANPRFRTQMQSATKRSPLRIAQEEFIFTMPHPFSLHMEHLGHPRCTSGKHGHASRSRSWCLDFDVEVEIEIAGLVCGSDHSSFWSPIGSWWEVWTC